MKELRKKSQIVHRQALTPSLKAKDIITKRKVIRIIRVLVTSTVKVNISMAVATRVVQPGEGDNGLTHTIHNTLTIALKIITPPDIIVIETTITISVIGTANCERQTSHQSSTTVGNDTIGVRMVGDGHRIMIIPVLLYRLILCSRGNQRKNISITEGREGSRSHLIGTAAIDTVDTTNITTAAIRTPTISPVMTAKGEPTVER